MEKEVARAIIAISVSMDNQIGKLFSETRNITDERVREQFNQAGGNVMGLIARDLIFPVVAIYPDLDPDKSPSLDGKADVV